MFARTARLMLRPGWPEDAIPLARAIGHEAVAGRLARVPWPYALGDAQWFLQQPCDAGTARFLVFDDPGGSPRLVGGIEVVRDGPGSPCQGGELGYWFTPDAWGRGYATEAGRAVVAIARHALGLTHLHATPFVDNVASGRVLEKLGFRPVGQAPLFSVARGAEAPGTRYELTLAEAPCGDAPLPLAA